MPEYIRDELALLQYERIGALVPIIYFAVAMIAIVGASASGGGFDILYHAILPLGFVIMGVVRSVTWYRRKSHMVDVLKIRRYLRSTTIIAMVMSLVGGLWTIDSYYETVEARRVLAPIFIFMIVFAGAVCLTSLPRAAVGMMSTALFLPLLVMILSPDAGISAMGISLLIVTLLLIGLIVNNFAEIVSGLKLRHELRHLADTDALTGLANRRAFANRFDLGKAEAGEESSLAVVMIDLDGFKRANDQYGHAAGDAVLIEVAERLQMLCTEAQSIARLGGDEFAILFSVTDDRAYYTAQCTAIRKMLSLPYHGDEQAISISASIGLAFYPEHGGNLSSLMHHADGALYREKQKTYREEQRATSRRRA